MHDLVLWYLTSLKIYCVDFHFLQPPSRLQATGFFKLNHYTGIHQMTKLCTLHVLLSGASHQHWQCMVSAVRNVSSEKKPHVTKNLYKTSLAFHVFHRLTEWLRLKGTSGGHLIQPLAQAEIPRGGCPGPSPGFYRSPRREPPVSVQTPSKEVKQNKTKKHFLTLRGNLLCSSLYPLLLVLTLGTTEECLHAFCTVPSST